MRAAKPWPVMLMVRALGPGGSERQVAELAKALDRNSFEPHVGCFLDSGLRADELRRQGVPLLHMTMRSFLSLDSPRAFSAMRRYVRAHGIQLVHTFDFPMNIFGVPAARLLGVPVVLSSQRSFRSLIPTKFRAAVQVSDHLAHGMVVNCEAIRRHLIRDYAISDRKIHLCYNALDTSTFHPRPRRRPPALENASLVIGVVSVLRAIKGIETLIEAFARVRSHQAGMRLVVVGSGDQRDLLEKRARELGIADACLFQPATEDVAPWLRAIDVFVLPSLSEALSNALMEAMACGCSVVASRVGGNPELVRPGETGLLFESGNAADLAQQLLTLIADERLRSSLACAAAGWVATEFSTARSVKRMEQIYESHLVLRA